MPPASCIVVSPRSPLRREVEQRLADVYRQAFGARLPSLPPSLVAWRDEDGALSAAAALRWRPETFFLSHYLTKPVAEWLSNEAGGPAPRLVEVCHLGAWRRRAGAPLVRGIIALTAQAGADWALFTATRPLRRLLEGLDVPFRVLEPARREQVADADRWGRYYECDPWVCAVGRSSLPEGDA